MRATGKEWRGIGVGGGQQLDVPDALHVLRPVGPRHPLQYCSLSEPAHAVPALAPSSAAGPAVKNYRKKAKRKSRRHREDSVSESA